MSPNADAPSRRYHFFILGLWMQPGSRPAGQAAWRIVLEDPHTAQRTSFTTLAELGAFLSDWMKERVSDE